MPFEFERLDIPDVVLVTPRVFPDDRGFFKELYKYSDFAAFGIKERFVQDNFSKSSKDVLRGLHYQVAPNAQGKLVSCQRGEIFDVAVDIRADSGTFGRWVSAVLTGENHKMLYIPPGFAHAFVVLSDTVEVMYKCTNEYSPKDDRGIIWNDPDININWTVKTPLVSDKDARLPRLKDAVKM
ncbi:dTDP-4-dehydrorhamnose 3,5-epimerase [Candidatus Magnetominusculus dajiuhuensis]|uniref:dTDP-4-dehydrorhamnose 3,5-epimerase n=1 Tax=Candidatus Magnetominusculus dajiuhuensis TaxID=3137712 RepID=UPI003B43C18D